jgi:hypothetical protein
MGDALLELLVILVVPVLLAEQQGLGLIRSLDLLQQLNAMGDGRLMGLLGMLGLQAIQASIALGFGISRAKAIANGASRARADQTTEQRKQHGLG